MSSRSYGEDLTRLKISLIEEAKSTSYIIMHAEEQESSEFATAEERDRMACWVHVLTKDLGYNYRVFYRATSLMDAFLSTVKVRHRYVQCVSATCFYIAAKLEVDSESVNSLQETLIDKYGCECSRRDIQRMELIIMQKLEFNLCRPTIDDFISSFHSLALTSNLFRMPKSVSIRSHLSRMYKCGQHVVCSHHLMKYKPSLLALAVLGCDLKLLDCDWLSTILSLQTVAQVRGGELSVCYEALAADYPRLAAQYLLTPPNKPIRQGWRRVTKSVSAPLPNDKTTGTTESSSESNNKGQLLKSGPLRHQLNSMMVNTATCIV